MEEAKKLKTFALAGNPNCGKTTLFNSLTGSTAHVGNWPGVTVDKREGTYKKTKEPVSIVDLPGIYSLSPYTPEEVISRNFILDEKPDCVINIVDATNLERNLYLTTQILEMDVPVIIALNMMDLVKKNGDDVDPKVLEKHLGVPVICISALKEDNLEELMNRAYTESEQKREGKTVLEATSINSLINNCKNAFINQEVENPLFHAIKLAEGDEIETKNHQDLVNIVNEFKQSFNDEAFGTDIEAYIADARYKFISENCSKAKSRILKNEKDKLTKSDKADKILTNRILGIPIFLVILFLVFHLTFSENLFYLGGIFESNGVTTFNEGGFFEGLFYTDAGINSPGVILANFLGNITDGITGLVAGWMEESPAWLSGFICDGVLAGLFSVLSFLPQILFLFLFFSILEDTGYMARVAFILDRIFRRFGLSGRAFMPMIMGFGCSVPAMINTRTLADERERVATIRVIPFFSCGAKLPILTAIAGAICEIFNFPNVDLITYSMYLLGMVTAIVTVIIMRHTTMRGKVSPFIMELPTYHVPQFKALMYHLWDKVKHFVKKAFTIILASTIVIWFLQSFTWNWKYIETADVAGIAEDAYAEYVDTSNGKTSVEALGYETEGDEAVDFATIVADYQELENEEDITAYEVVISQVLCEAAAQYNAETSEEGYLTTSDSILAGLGQLIQPIFTPLGFGSQLDRDNGWVFGVSAVTGLIAKENVIATFAVLAQCTTDSSEVSVTDFNEYLDLYLAVTDEDGVYASTAMIKASGIDLENGWPILIAFIVFNMTTIPCFAAVSTAKAELPEKKLWKTILFWIATSYITSTIVYLVLSWWWTSFIFAALAVGIGFLIHYLNKKKDAKLAC